MIRRRFSYKSFRLKRTSYRKSLTDDSSIFAQLAYREDLRRESAFRLERADAAIRFVVGLVEPLRIAREAFVAMLPCVRTEFFAMLVVLCWRLTTIPPLEFTSAGAH